MNGPEENEREQEMQSEVDDQRMSQEFPRRTRVSGEIRQRDVGNLRRDTLAIRGGVRKHENDGHRLFLLRRGDLKIRPRAILVRRRYRRRQHVDAVDEGDGIRRRPVGREPSNAISPR